MSRTSKRHPLLLSVLLGILTFNLTLTMLFCAKLAMASSPPEIGCCYQCGIPGTPGTDNCTTAIFDPDTHVFTGCNDKLPYTCPDPDTAVCHPRDCPGC